MRVKWPRSAYMASAPVTHSTTPPSMTHPWCPWSIKNLKAQCGDTAANTPADRESRGVF